MSNDKETSGTLSHIIKNVGTDEMNPIEALKIIDQRHSFNELSASQLNHFADTIYNMDINKIEKVDHKTLDLVNRVLNRHLDGLAKSNDPDFYKHDQKIKSVQQQLSKLVYQKDIPSWQPLKTPMLQNVLDSNRAIKEFPMMEGELKLDTDIWNPVLNNKGETVFKKTGKVKDFIKAKQFDQLSAVYGPDGNLYKVALSPEVIDAIKSTGVSDKVGVLQGEGAKRGIELTNPGHKVDLDGTSPKDNYGGKGKAIETSFGDFIDEAQDVLNRVKEEKAKIKFYQNQVRELYKEARTITDGIREIQDDLSLTEAEQGEKIRELYKDRFFGIADEMITLQQRKNAVRSPIVIEAKQFLQLNEDHLYGATLDPGQMKSIEAINLGGLTEGLLDRETKSLHPGLFNINRPGTLSSYLWKEQALVNTDSRYIALQQLDNQLGEIMGINIANESFLLKNEIEDFHGSPLDKIDQKIVDAERSYHDRVQDFASESANKAEYGERAGGKIQQASAEQTLHNLASQVNMEVPTNPKERQRYLDAKANLITAAVKEGKTGQVLQDLDFKIKPTKLLSQADINENILYDEKISEILKNVQDTVKQSAKHGRESSPIEAMRRAMAENLLINKDGTLILQDETIDKIVNDNLTRWSKHIDKSGQQLYGFSGDMIAYRLTDVNGTTGTFEADSIRAQDTTVKLDINQAELENTLKAFNDKYSTKVVTDYDPFVDKILRSNLTYIGDGKFMDAMNIADQVVNDTRFMRDAEGMPFRGIKEAEKILTSRLGFTMDRNPDLYRDAMQDLSTAMEQAISEQKSMLGETFKPAAVASEDILRWYYKLQNMGSAYLADGTHYEGATIAFEETRLWHSGRMATLELIKETQKANPDAASDTRFLTSKLLQVRDYLTENVGHETNVNWANVGYFNAIRALSIDEIKRITHDAVHGGELAQKNASPIEFVSMMDSAKSVHARDDKGDLVLQERSYEDILQQDRADDFERRTNKNYSPLYKKTLIEDAFQFIRGEDSKELTDEQIMERIRKKNPTIQADQLKAALAIEKQDITKKRLDIHRMLDISQGGEIGRDAQSAMAAEYLALIEPHQESYYHALKETGRIAGDHFIEDIFDKERFIEELISEDDTVRKEIIDKARKGDYTTLQTIALMGDQKGITFEVRDDQGQVFKPVMKDSQLFAQYENYHTLITKGWGDDNKLRNQRIEDLGLIRPREINRTVIDEVADVIAPGQDTGYVKSVGAEFDSLIRMKSGDWLKINPVADFRNLKAFQEGMGAVVVDFETTGLLTDPNAQILEIATMDMQMVDGESQYGKATSTLIKPTMETIDRFHTIIDSTAQEIMDEHVGKRTQTAKQLAVDMERLRIDNEERTAKKLQLQAMQEVIAQDDIMFLRNIAKYQDSAWGRRDVQNLSNEYTVSRLFTDATKALQHLEEEGVELWEGLDRLTNAQAGKITVGHNYASFDQIIHERSLAAMERNYIDRILPVLDEPDRAAFEKYRDNGDISVINQRKNHAQKTLDKLVHKVGDLDENKVIHLNEPLINPWYTEGKINRVADVFGITNAALKKMSSGDIVEQLRNTDFNQTLGEVESTLKTGELTRTQKTNLRRRQVVLQGLIEDGITPEDMILDRIPTVDRKFMTANLLETYRGINKASKEIERSKDRGETPANIRKWTGNRDEALRNLMGTLTPFDEDSSVRTGIPGRPLDGLSVKTDKGTEYYDFIEHSRTVNGILNDFADAESHVNRINGILDTLDKINGISREKTPIIDTLPLFRMLKPGRGHTIEHMVEFFDINTENLGDAHLAEVDVQLTGQALGQGLSPKLMDRNLDSYQKDDLFAVVNKEGIGGTNIDISEYRFIEQEGSNVKAYDTYADKEVTFEFRNSIKGQRFFSQNVKPISTPGEWMSQVEHDDVFRSVSKALNKGIEGINRLEDYSSPDRIDRFNQARDRVQEIHAAIQSGDRDRYLSELPTEDKILFMNRHLFKDPREMEEQSPRSQQKWSAIRETLETPLFKEVITPKMQEVQDLYQSGKIAYNDAEELVKNINNAIRERAPKTKVNGLYGIVGDMPAGWEGERVDINIDLSTEGTAMRSLMSQAEIVGSQLWPSEAEQTQKSKAINQVILPFMRENVVRDITRLEDATNYLMENKERLIKNGSLYEASQIDWQASAIGSPTEGSYIAMKAGVDQAFDSTLGAINERRVNQGYEITPGHDLTESTIQEARSATTGKYGTLAGMNYKLGTIHSSQAEGLDVVDMKIGREAPGLEGMTLDEIWQGFTERQQQVEELNQAKLELFADIKKTAQENSVSQEHLISQAWRSGTLDKINKPLQEIQTERDVYLRGLTQYAEINKLAEDASGFALRTRELISHVDYADPSGNERLLKWDWEAASRGNKIGINYAGYKLSDIPEEELIDYVKHQDIPGHGRERDLVWNYLRKNDYGYQTEGGNAVFGNDARMLPSVGKPFDIVRNINNETRERAAEAIAKIEPAGNEEVTAINRQIIQAGQEAQEQPKTSYVRTLIDDFMNNNRAKMGLAIAGGLMVAGLALKQATARNPFDNQQDATTEQSPNFAEEPAIPTRTYMNDSEIGNGARIRVRARGGDHEQIGGIVGQAIESEMPGVNVNVNATDNTSRVDNSYVGDIFNQFVSRGYVLNRGD